jgi:hypothetical protein
MATRIACPQNLQVYVTGQYPCTDGSVTVQHPTARQYMTAILLPKVPRRRAADRLACRVELRLARRFHVRLAAWNRHRRFPAQGFRHRLQCRIQSLLQMWFQMCWRLWRVRSLSYARHHV